MDIWILRLYILRLFSKRKKQSMLKWMGTGKVDTLKNPMDCFYSINVLCLVLTWILKQCLCVPSPHTSPIYRHRVEVGYFSHVAAFDEGQFLFDSLFSHIRKMLRRLAKNYSCSTSQSKSVLKRPDYVFLCYK